MGTETEKNEVKEAKFREKVLMSFEYLLVVISKASGLLIFPIV